jgi:hypothetical protein
LTKTNGYEQVVFNVGGMIRHISMGIKPILDYSWKERMSPLISSKSLPKLHEKHDKALFNEIIAAILRRLIGDSEDNKK